jgi:lipoteichoic acid synthase
MLLSDLAVNIQGTMKLTYEQEAIIQKEIDSSLHSAEKRHPDSRIKNIIFILVESYTAFTTDMEIDGKEVTPFLNRLRHEPDVYYNGRMKSNITIGQSSDGQFIYMTGLLPLRSIITVSKAKDRTLMAMPKLITLFNEDIETRMIIPTLPSLWEQDAMCNAYGFQRLYSSNDYTENVGRNLNDEQVFKLAEEIDMKSSKPFFSYILTMSMHGPYNKQIDPSFKINSKMYCEELTNFLNVCHYTDKQIEKYIMHLKNNNLYENSLIIIAPDHQVPENTVNVEQYGLTRELPLFIINGNIEQQETWSGECNQLDVFPTLLDLLGIDSRWRGLGNSLLSPTYQNSLTDQKWTISEWILQSDYFKKQGAKYSNTE